MKDFILLIHRDTSAEVGPDLWPVYFAKLSALGAFAGGSAIGTGDVMREDGTAREITSHLAGYIRIQAESRDAAKR